LTRPQVGDFEVAIGGTTAQKSEMCNFRPGQLLVFHRAVKGIEKNQTVEVARVENNKMLVRSAHGELRAVTAM
jgi:hypothetical protein